MAISRQLKSVSDVRMALSNRMAQYRSEYTRGPLVRQRPTLVSACSCVFSEQFPQCRPNPMPSSQVCLVQESW